MLRANGLAAAARSRLTWRAPYAADEDLSVLSTSTPLRTAGCVASLVPSRPGRSAGFPAAGCRDRMPAQGSRISPTRPAHPWGRCPNDNSGGLSRPAGGRRPQLSCGRPRPIACLAGHRPSDQPMMAERVGQPSLAQPIRLVRDRRNLDGPVRDGPRREPVRVSDQKVEPHRGAPVRTPHADDLALCRANAAAQSLTRNANQ